MAPATSGTFARTTVQFAHAPVGGNDRRLFTTDPFTRSSNGRPVGRPLDIEPGFIVRAVGPCKIDLATRDGSRGEVVRRRGVGGSGGGRGRDRCMSSRVPGRCPGSWSHPRPLSQFQRSQPGRAVIPGERDLAALMVLFISHPC